MVNTCGRLIGRYLENQPSIAAAALTSHVYKSVTVKPGFVPTYQQIALFNVSGSFE